METNERVKKIVKETFNLKDEKIEDSWTSEDIAGWDSLGHLKLVMAIEKEFNVKFEIEDMFKIQSICDINDFLKKKLLTV